ncbi:hypothetical protein HHK36_024187 [Tetracentron sinense]|uniref:DUF4283 domain-containing protein n=1 Tax=Tetracentron sinense TaxID=13715 RepID=A0A835D413_TETSI|nr:hypothetical protein HHK36_024187 [Tetracentron sinense]
MVSSMAAGPMIGGSSSRPPDPSPSYAEIAKGKTYVEVSNDSRSLVPEQVNISKTIAAYQGEPALFLTPDESAKLASPLKLSLVAKCSYGRPSFPAIREFFKKQFHLKFDYHIGVLDPRHLLIRFSAEEDYLTIYLKEYCYINGLLLRFIKWTPTFCTGLEPSIIPIWISLPNLPLHLYQEQILRSIGSAVGKVLCLDGPTKMLTRPNKARLCVDMDVTKHKASRIWLDEDRTNVNSKIINLETEEQLHEKSGDEAEDLHIINSEVRSIQNSGKEQISTQNKEGDPHITNIDFNNIQNSRKEHNSSHYKEEVQPEVIPGQALEVANAMASITEGWKTDAKQSKLFFRKKNLHSSIPPSRKIPNDINWRSSSTSEFHHEKDIMSMIATETPDTIINEVRDYLFAVLIDGSRDTLIAIVKKHNKIDVFFNLVSNVVNVVRASCKHHDILREKQVAKIIEALKNGELSSGHGLNQETSLKRVGDTRWGSHYDTLISLIIMFSSVTDVFEIVDKDCSKMEQRFEVCALLESTLTFEFAFFLHLMKIILGITNDLSKALQRKKQDIVNTMTLVQVSKQQLQVMRDNGWDTLFTEIYLFCAKQMIIVPNMDEKFVAPGRSRHNAKEITNLYHYRSEYFYTTIDMQLQ